jgi:hypothetical protein
VWACGSSKVAAKTREVADKIPASMADGNEEVSERHRKLGPSVEKVESVTGEPLTGARRVVDEVLEYNVLILRNVGKYSRLRVELSPYRGSQKTVAF